MARHDNFCQLTSTKKVVFFTVTKTTTTNQGEKVMKGLIIYAAIMFALLISAGYALGL